MTAGNTSLIRARARTSRARLIHTVVVDEHYGAHQLAICGMRSRYGWVLDPTGISSNLERELERCAKCERLEDKA